MKIPTALLALCLSLCLVSGKEMPFRQTSVCTDPSEEQTYPVECKEALEQLDVPSLVLNWTSTTIPDSFDALLDQFCRVECVDPYVPYLQCRREEIVAEVTTMTGQTVAPDKSMAGLLTTFLCGQSDDQFCMEVILDYNGTQFDVVGIASNCNTTAENRCTAHCLQEVQSLLDYFGCCSELIDPLIEANVNTLLGRILVDQPIANLAATCSLAMPDSCPSLAESESSTITAAVSLVAFMSLLPMFVF